MNFFAGLVLAAVSAILPVLVSWFQKHVLPQNAALKDATPEMIRAHARQWVLDAITEFVTALEQKNVIPAWLKLFESPIESALAEAIDSALDAAGL